MDLAIFYPVNCIGQGLVELRTHIPLFLSASRSQSAWIESSEFFSILFSPSKTNYFLENPAGRPLMRALRSDIESNVHS